TGPGQTPSAVTDTTTAGPAATSPPTTAAPARSASAAIPADISISQATSVSDGATNATSRAVVRPPIALMSDRLPAAALAPTSDAVDQWRRKSTPSTRTSTEVTTSPPGTASTALSSPGPTRTSSPEPRPAVTASISANSPIS